MKVDEEKLDSEILRMVNHYRDLRHGGSSMQSSMYREAMWQYADMANGGDGGPGDSSGGTTTTIRHDYYKGYPDSFFMQVLSALGEFSRCLVHD